MDEITEEVTIVNLQGMHARPAGLLVNAALKFQSDVHILKNGERINAKSILGLLTLAAAQGTRLTVTCRGTDAREAMNAVRALIESGFNNIDGK